MGILPSLHLYWEQIERNTEIREKTSRPRKRLPSYHYLNVIIAINEYEGGAGILYVIRTHQIGPSILNTRSQRQENTHLLKSYYLHEY